MNIKATGVSVFLVVAMAANGMCADFPFLGEVTKGPVNVRAGANTNFEAVDKLMQGAQVVVLAKSYEWYKIQMPSSAAAYVRSTYIMEHGNNMGEVTGSNLNVRAKADGNASVVGQLGKGDVVKLLAKVNDWWKVEPPAVAVAWVHADFMRKKSSQVAHLMRKPLAPVLDEHKAPVPVVAAVVTRAPAPTVKRTTSTTSVEIQGKLELLPAHVQDAHYQVVVSALTAYYIQDVPGLERFNKAMVHIEGIVLPEDKPTLYPLVQVKKISLVL